MKDIALFTDVSVNPGLRLGIGAYLVMPASLLEASGEIDSAELTDQIKVQRFENSSSTKLELQTVLWAIGEQRKALKGKIRIYSDSQCVSGLLKRRARLVAENFVSSRTTLPLKNAPLYRSFYECHDELDFEVVKVKGHGRVSARDKVHRIFSLVDKSARKALRLWMDELAEATDASAGSVQDENWCVYLLRCRNNSLYTGMTNNIVRRLKEHEQGRGSKFVRSWRPFELVKTIPCRNAGEARRLEYE
ncbi:MAG: GIY-YIG nuclease family protein, partial [Nitrospirae bacterium]|nr:GIY-YIG nuclease family protein [Nitrospirota bacterium]